jgi:hypothetical protein
MNNVRVWALLFAAGLAAAGWAYWRGQTQQAAVLNEIMALENRLATTNAQAAKANAAVVRGIGQAVYYNRFPRRDVAVLDESQEIALRCRALADTLHAWQRRLRARAGERADGPLRAPATPTAQPAAEAAALTQAVNRYTDFVRAYVPEAPQLFPPAGSETTHSQPWLYADGAPLAAALGSLSGLEALARQLAVTALSHQAEKVGSTYILFTKIGPMAVATSTTVAPGAVYEARLFMTQSSPTYKVDMRADGRPIAADYNNQGAVAFRVPPLGPGQPDTVRAHWRGVIRTPFYEADTTFQLNVPYSIIKPRTR